MMHPENLRAGQWVAITRCRKDQQIVTRKGGLWIEADEVTFDGQPLHVVAVSYPFACVDHPTGRRLSIDLRAFDVTRVSRHYAKAMLAALKPTAAGIGSPAAPGAGCCPRCGSKLVQRRVAESRTWIPVCPECDKSQPPAKKGVVIQ